MGLKVILFLLGANAVLLYGLALLWGGRIRFGGIVPVLSVAVFLVPINVFIRDLTTLVGIPDKLCYVFIAAVVCNGVALYALSYVIPRFRIDNFRTALAFSALMGAVALFLNFYLADQIAALL